MLNIRIYYVIPFSYLPDTILLLHKIGICTANYFYADLLGVQYHGVGQAHTMGNSITYLTFSGSYNFAA